MAQKKISTKEKILEAAWTLFHQKGYEGTTINDIIAESHTSRGAFYHHFRGKDDLLFSVAYLFDDEYKEWRENMDTNRNSLERLLEFDAYVLKNLEESKYRPFFASLYGLQVMTEGNRRILDPQRQYYQLVAQIMKEGLEKGEIKSTLSYLELTEWFAIIQRGFTYDWCLTRGRYSLLQYGQRMMKVFLESLKPEHN